MRIKEHITKKLLIRLAFFLALTGAALVLDAYFEKNPADFDNLKSGTEEHNPEQGEVYVLAQTTSFSVKSSVQRVSTRSVQIEKQAQFLRNYYSIRNYQVRKAEAINQTSPLIASYHFLAFQTHLFPPDEDTYA